MALHTRHLPHADFSPNILSSTVFVFFSSTPPLYQPTPPGLRQRLCRIAEIGLPLCPTVSAASCAPPPRSIHILYTPGEPLLHLVAFLSSPHRAVAPERPRFGALRPSLAPSTVPPQLDLQRPPRRASTTIRANEPNQPRAASPSITPSPHRFIDLPPPLAS